MPAIKKSLLSVTALAMFVSTASYANTDAAQNRFPADWRRNYECLPWHRLQELQPDWKQVMVEKLDGVALESSNGWNNAGTGHSANMELNYTPERPDGSIDVSKALDINEQFMISRQFWTAQVKRGILHDPHAFINSTPHMSFVWGDNVEYLQNVMPHCSRPLYSVA